MSDPTTSVPWTVDYREADLGPFRMMAWCVIDSQGKVVFAFPPIPNEKTSEQCEALARMVAGGSTIALLKDERAIYRNDICVLERDVADLEKERDRLRAIADELAAAIAEAKPWNLLGPVAERLCLALDKYEAAKSPPDDGAEPPRMEYAK